LANGGHSMIHLIHLTSLKIHLINGSRTALHMIDAVRSLQVYAKEPKGLTEITSMPHRWNRASQTGHTVPITRIIDWFQRR
jgi:hypothetical protein